ncbi:TraB/VirB10 family protein [Rheinheimera hassiensis]|uniref:TraB/VirB10 family protein n=1 Tax=Rheinheimera hassiensis TaxID=1193627 RepID=UPI001F0599B0|nr:TrbI/VirB10 family protein [Rheinheimera hassiensis]
MQQIKLMWANPDTRKYIVYGFIAVAMVFLFNSMGSEESGPKASKKYSTREGTAFGVASSASKIAESDSASVIKELTQTFAEKEKDIDVRETAMNKKMADQEKSLLELQASVFELTKKLDASLKMQTRDLQADQPGQQGVNQAGKARVQGEKTTVDVVDRQGNIVQRNQTQIITPQQPAIEGRVIRTITQRNVREVRKSGEVEQKDIQVSELTQRNQKINDTSAKSKAEQENKSVVGENDGEFTLTMGSIITGVLLNGAALPTSSSGQKDPMPILMRVKKEAIMPNHFTLDIRECHLLGSGIGDLASSRGYIRAEAISCITNDGQAIEKNITAYATSAGDGMSGIAGDVVFKSGAMLSNAMKAEFLANFGKAIAPQRVQSLNVNPGQSSMWEAQNFNYAGASGVAGGFGGAAERLSQYYMDLVDQTFPVIEVLPGTEVDFIVQKGMTMKLGGEVMAGVQQ